MKNTKLPDEGRRRADGPAALRAMLRYRRHRASAWEETEMNHLNNDRWRAAFDVTELGRYQYTVEGWVDGFLSWRQDFVKRVEPQDIELALRTGAKLVEAAATRATGAQARELHEVARALVAERPLEERRRIAASEALLHIVMRYPDRSHSSVYPIEFEVVVDRPLARCAQGRNRSSCPLSRNGRRATSCDRRLRSRVS